MTKATSGMNLTPVNCCSIQAFFRSEFERRREIYLFKEGEYAMDLKLPEGLEAVVPQPQPKQKKAAKALAEPAFGLTAAQRFQVLSGLLVLFLLLAAVMTYFAAQE